MDAGKSIGPLSRQEEELLRALTRVAVVLPRLMDADLETSEGLSLNEYLVLMLLSEAPGRRMRMSELAAHKDHSPSGMTRLVDRLCRSGWVKREKSTCDGRESFAVLTDGGRERLRDAYPAHLASVRRHLIDHLGGLDLPAFTDALNKIGSDCADVTACGSVPEGVVQPQR